MKIVFMGTPSFAVPSMESLINAGYEISLVLTQPDKKGNRNKIVSSPVKMFSLENKIDIEQPISLKNNTEIIDKIRKIEPDFIVVAAYGQILSKEILDIPKYCCLNVHASLLPKYRGASPMQMSIVNGDKESGVSIMRMDEGLDTGDVVLSESSNIVNKNITEVSDDLSKLGANILIKAIKTIASGNATFEKQDETKSTYAHIIKKEDGLTDFDENAEKLEAKIRGYYEWPTLHSFYDEKMFKFFKAEIVDEKPVREAGTIDAILKDSFVINCSDKKLKILELQVQGKKKMSAADYIRGSKISVGDKFSRR